MAQGPSPEVRERYLKQVDKVRRDSCMNRVFILLFALAILIPILLEIMGR